MGTTSQKKEINNRKEIPIFPVNVFANVFSLCMKLIGWYYFWIFQIFLLPFHAYQAGTFPNTYIEIVQSHIRYISLLKIEQLGHS